MTFRREREAHLRATKHHKNAGIKPRLSQGFDLARSPETPPEVWQFENSHRIVSTRCPHFPHCPHRRRHRMLARAVAQDREPARSTERDYVRCSLFSKAEHEHQELEVTHEATVRPL